MDKMKSAIEAASSPWDPKVRILSAEDQARQIEGQLGQIYSAIAALRGNFPREELEGEAPSLATLQDHVYTLTTRTRTLLHDLSIVEESIS